MYSITKLVEEERKRRLKELQRIHKIYYPY